MRLLAFALILLLAPAVLAYEPAVVATGKRGAVAADHELASQAGVAMLRAGGNALDAAIASALVLGVVGPSGSGIGGGGFLVYWSAKEKKAHALDFREVGPAALTPQSFFRGGRPDTRLSQRGGLAAGVPGEIAGLAEAHGRFGRLPWKRLFQPAIAAARDGFVVDETMAEDAASNAPELDQFPALKELLTRNGRLVRQGDRIENRDLARTLDIIARKGRKGFYEGEVARKIVDTVRKTGGVMTMQDLAGYRPRWRDPVRGLHRGWEIYSMPPPSSGGAILLQILQCLEAMPIDWKARGSARAIHLVAEAQKHAFADRAAFFGDPDFVDVPVRQLLSERHVRQIVRSIRPDRTQPPEAYAHPLPDDSGTTHISAMDAEGNACGLTSTINTGFGSLVVVEGAGFVLNNEMDDFSIAGGVANAFGLVGSKANEPAAGKRPLSSMSPTIVVEQGRPVLVAGGSGGPHIITGTLSVLTGVLDSGLDVGEAVSAPRLHHQWSPDRLVLERDVSESSRRELESYGHAVSVSDGGSAIQAVQATPDGFRAASDPRKGGVAAAY